MGGCCCCSSKGTELNAAPTYYYFPRTSDEQVPLSSRQGGASAVSTGLLVDTNLDTSIPDTYRPPPAPIPYDVAIEDPHTPPSVQEICGSKSESALQTATNSDSVQEAVGRNTREASPKCEDLKDADCKAQTDSELDPLKKSEVELAKSVESFTLSIEEEDLCPTCLEEYDPQNPKITTKCDHHFHLACILEWMERSDTCPVCDQEMIFESPI
ncbi:hypothetical protein FF2_037731 [Malus domestica]